MELATAGTIRLRTFMLTPTGRILLARQRSPEKRFRPTISRPRLNCAHPLTAATPPATSPGSRFITVCVDIGLLIVFAGLNMFLFCFRFRAVNLRRWRSTAAGCQLRTEEHPVHCQAHERHGQRDRSDWRLEIRGHGAGSLLSLDLHRGLLRRHGRHHPGGAVPLRRDDSAGSAVSCLLSDGHQIVHVKKQNKPNLLLRPTASSYFRPSPPHTHTHTQQGSWTPLIQHFLCYTIHIYYIYISAVFLSYFFFLLLRVSFNRNKILLSFNSGPADRVRLLYLFFFPPILSFSSALFFIYNKSNLPALPPRFLFKDIFFSFFFLLAIPFVSTFFYFYFYSFSCALLPCCSIVFRLGE